MTEQANENINTWKNQAEFLSSQSKTVIIATNEDYRSAGEKFADIKRERKNLEAERKTWVAPLQAQVKRLNEQFKAIDAQLELAQKPYEQGMLAFKEEEDRQRQEAERKAEEERKRLAKEAQDKADAEVQRLNAAREAQRQAEEQAQSEDPVTAYLASKKAEDHAREAEQARIDAENSIRESVMAPRAVVAITATPKATAAGTSYRTTWKARVIDASIIPRQFMLPDEKTLTALAKAKKGPSDIPGVEFYAEKTIGGR